MYGLPNSNLSNPPKPFHDIFNHTESLLVGYRRLAQDLRSALLLEVLPGFIIWGAALLRFGLGLPDLPTR